jgi:hypothetical protein
MNISEQILMLAEFSLLRSVDIEFYSRSENPVANSAIIKMIIN